jgi:hypothetical protein
MTTKPEFTELRLNGTMLAVSGPPEPDPQEADRRDEHTHVRVVVVQERDGAPPARFRGEIMTRNHHWTVQGPKSGIKVGKALAFGLEVQTTEIAATPMASAFETFTWVQAVEVVEENATVSGGATGV